MQMQKNPISASLPTNQTAIEPVTLACFATIKQAAKLRPAFSEAAFRDIRFKAFDRKNTRGDIITGNGSGEFGCWIVLGGKVLLDLERFDAWIKSHKARA